MGGGAPGCAHRVTPHEILTAQDSFPPAPHVQVRRGERRVAGSQPGARSGRGQSPHAGGRPLGQPAGAQQAVALVPRRGRPLDELPQAEVAAVPGQPGSHAADPRLGGHRQPQAAHAAGAEPARKVCLRGRPAFAVHGGHPARRPGLPGRRVGNHRSGFRANRGFAHRGSRSEQEPRMKRIPPLARWLAGVGTAGLLALGSVAAHADAGSLRGRYTELKPQLQSNSYGREMYIDSAETSNSLQGDVYAVLDYPFAKVNEALQDPNAWCDIMLLPFNTKSCQANGNHLAVGIARKPNQPADQAYRIDFGLTPGGSGENYLA